MVSEKMVHRIELVAQAIYETAQTGCLWANEPTIRKEPSGNMPAMPSICWTMTSAFFFWP